ncbi:MAG: cysteine--tRNA ligase [Methylophilus sp.]
MIKIYNTLARDKQTFTPIEAGKVRMYVCGMTVYDFCHLGHARVMVVFDMISRWFRASGYDVTYVRNITDIDDKIIKRANENNETIDQLTQRFIDAMDEDSAKLGIIRPDIEPRATAHIDGMIQMIAKLIEKDHAYQAANGDVFYKVRSFNDYGKLSGKTLDDLRAGERVEVDTFKQDPMDFVLWKSVKPNEPHWPSPWGNGRPGWHIECSAMSTQHLGAHFDIHGGGQDLQFPHHENEIAQSEGTHDCTMANYWMHNGFVRVDDEKMSKSLGNFFTIREVLQKYLPEVVRFFILRAHYRSPLNYSDKHLDDASIGLKSLYTPLNGLDIPLIEIDWNNELSSQFKSAMDDDFNTHQAIEVLKEIARQVNITKSLESAALLKALGGILGLLQDKPENILKGDVVVNLTGQQIHLLQGFLKAETTITADLTTDEGKDELVKELIEQRAKAKKTKNFAEADRIRKELADAGIILEDTPNGTTWRSA